MAVTGSVGMQVDGDSNFCPWMALLMAKPPDTDVCKSVA